ncbi:hypothetical protein LZ554_005961 [Drepanopeziza brunnea f. sp. 'monogermtubi']|nr:hypothetical protein LZ554_005961 [Drepanopeziza brunnea f. sp. 'monogermtubi']
MATWQRNLHRQEAPKRLQDKPISVQQGRDYGLAGNIGEQQLHGRSPPTFPQDNANVRPPPISHISERVQEQPRRLNRRREEDFTSRPRSSCSREAGYGGDPDQRDVRARECQYSIPGRHHGAVPGSHPWTTPPPQKERKNFDRVPPARSGNMVRIPALRDDGRRFDQVPARHGIVAEGRDSRNRFRNDTNEGFQPWERYLGDDGPLGITRTSDWFLRARRGGYVDGDEQPPAAAAQPHWRSNYDRDVTFGELVARSEEIMDEKWLDNLHPEGTLGLAELQRYYRVMERKHRKGCGDGSFGH